MSAWIEIVKQKKVLTWWRVALYMSAWIEIVAGPEGAYVYWGRTLHECVD